MVGWNVEVPSLVGFTFNNEELIPLVFSMQIYWFMYGFIIYCIFVVIMLVIIMYSISDDVWIYLCFYL